MKHKNVVGLLIKIIAIVGWVLNSLGALIVGLATFIIDPDVILLPLLIILLTPCAAFVGALLLYGFGELIDKVCSIEYLARQKALQDNEDEDDGIYTAHHSNPYAAEEPIPAEALYAQGLISEEELHARTPDAPFMPVSEEQIDRHARLKRLLDQGLITEEEFQAALSKSTL